MKIIPRTKLGDIAEDPVTVFARDLKIESGYIESSEATEYMRKMNPKFRKKYQHHCKKYICWASRNSEPDLPDLPEMDSGPSEQTLGTPRRGAG